MIMHADVATSYNNLALVYNSLGEYDPAKELLEKALRIYVEKVRNNLSLLNNYLIVSRCKDRREEARLWWP